MLTNQQVDAFKCALKLHKDFMLIMTQIHVNNSVQKEHQAIMIQEYVLIYVYFKILNIHGLITLTISVLNCVLQAISQIIELFHVLEIAHKASLLITLQEDVQLLVLQLLLYMVIPQIELVFICVQMACLLTK